MTTLKQLESKFSVSIIQRDKTLVSFGEKYMVYHDKNTFTDYEFKNLKEVEQYLDLNCTDLDSVDEDLILKAIDILSKNNPSIEISYLTTENAIEIDRLIYPLSDDIINSFLDLIQVVCNNRMDTISYSKIYNLFYNSDLEDSEEIINDDDSNDYDFSDFKKKESEIYSTKVINEYPSENLENFEFNYSMINGKLSKKESTIQGLLSIDTVKQHLNDTNIPIDTYNLLAVSFKTTTKVLSPNQYANRAKTLMCENTSPSQKHKSNSYDVNLRREVEVLGTVEKISIGYYNPITCKISNFTVLYGEEKIEVSNNYVPQVIKNQSNNIARKNLSLIGNQTSKLYNSIKDELSLYFDIDNSVCLVFNGLRLGVVGKWLMLDSNNCSWNYRKYGNYYDDKDRGITLHKIKSLLNKKQLVELKDLLCDKRSNIDSYKFDDNQLIVYRGNAWAIFKFEIDNTVSNKIISVVLDTRISSDIETKKTIKKLTSDIEDKMLSGYNSLANDKIKVLRVFKKQLENFITQNIDTLTSTQLEIKMSEIKEIEKQLSFYQNILNSTQQLVAENVKIIHELTKLIKVKSLNNQLVAYFGVDHKAPIKVNKKVINHETGTKVSLSKIIKSVTHKVKTLVNQGLLKPLNSSHETQIDFLIKLCLDNQLLGIPKILCKTHAFYKEINNNYLNSYGYQLT
jgi:hypothetical protein